MNPCGSSTPELTGPALKPREQADGTATRQARAAAITAVVQELGGAPETLIEVLHRVQPLEGYLSRGALHQVARELRLPLSRVYGVASFYHLFERRAPAPHRIAVCRGTACFVNGAPRLLAAVAARLGVAGEGCRAGTWELRGCGCLGACGTEPVLRLNDGPAQRVPISRDGELRNRLTALGIPALPASSATPGAALPGAAPPGPA